MDTRQKLKSSVTPFPTYSHTLNCILQNLDKACGNCASTAKKYAFGGGERGMAIT